jgi:hypothetical protein
MAMIQGCGGGFRGKAPMLGDDNVRALIIKVITWSVARLVIIFG